MTHTDVDTKITALLEELRPFGYRAVVAVQSDDPLEQCEDSQVYNNCGPVLALGMLEYAKARVLRKMNLS